ncbi:MAG: hypothetical protein ACRDN0_09640 [Trebonia sp.]
MRVTIPRSRLLTAVGLVLLSLSGCHATPIYSGSGHITAPHGNTCAKPTVIPLDVKNAQSGVTRGKYYVTNDTWNASRYSGLSQAIYVCDYNNWYTVATMNNDTGDGAVKTSPNVQETWYPTPTKLSDWKSVTSHYSDVPPGTGQHYGVWEFEYDIWLNGLANSKSTEIMIWTFDNGQSPNGSLSGSFTDAGHTYAVYRTPPPYQYIAFVDKNGKLSGNVNLTAFFGYAISKGWLSSSATLYQICNGIELVSTNGKPEKFAINNFGIDMRG